MPRAQKPRATTKDPRPGGYKVWFAALGRQSPAVTLVIPYTALRYVLRKTGMPHVGKVSYIPLPQKNGRPRFHSPRKDDQVWLNR